MRIVFLGSPDFASQILKKLINWPKGQIVGVITQPDRPAGRGKKLTPSAVKSLACQLGLEIFQPQSLNQEDSQLWIREHKPDILVVVAYGNILPPKVLQIAPLGVVNVHASLLPKYRGAAPIQRSLLNGERVTGITIMQMDEGMDTGPILSQKALAIGIDDTAASLHDQLAELGGDLLIKTLDKLKQGTVQSIPQGETIASYAPKLKKEEGKIDWHQPAWEVHNLIRALYPWPGAYFEWPRKKNGQIIKLQIYPGKIGQDLSEKIEPGTFLRVTDDYLQVACTDKIYLIPYVKPASGKPLTPKAFQCGYL